MQTSVIPGFIGMFVSYSVWHQCSSASTVILEFSLIGTNADSVYLSSFWYPAPPNPFSTHSTAIISKISK